MKFSFCIILLLLQPVLLSAQGISFHKAYGSGNFDFGIDAVQLADSSYIILGNTSSFGNGNSDVLLVKIDSLGTVIWSKTYGTNLLDHGSDMELTETGEIIVVGYRLTEFSDYQTMVLKIDLNGELIWEKIFGSESWDFGENCLITQDNRIIVASNSVQNFNDDIAITELDQNGEIIETIYIASDVSDFVSGLTEDANSQIIVSSNQVSDSTKTVITWLSQELDSLISIKYFLEFNTISTDIIHASDEKLIVTGYQCDEFESVIAAFCIAIDYDGSVDWIYDLSVIDDKTKFFSATELENGIIIVAGELFDGNWDGFWHAVSGGWFIATGGHTVLGNFSGMDGFKNALATSDGGVIMIGSTETFSNTYSDVWAVKLNKNYETPLNATSQVISSVFELGLREQFLLYPNPGNSFINLNFHGIVDIEIYDHSARKVMELKHFNQTTINVEKLPSGIYTVLLFDEYKFLQSSRWIKNN